MWVNGQDATRCHHAIHGLVAGKDLVVIGFRGALRLLLACSVLAGLVTVLAAAPAQGATTPTTVPGTPPPATMISATTAAFGKMLVVGNGTYAGYTLYIITSDRPPTYGCTTTAVTVVGMPIACTGGPTTEWPALTTTGPPVAGPGVSQKLLGTVQRAGIGEQVTYAGHPLYLFEMSPFMITGEEFDEPGLPPWHGVWYLVTPTGQPLAWPGMLTTLQMGKKAVVAELMDTLAGWQVFPLYSHSGDSESVSNCTGKCSVVWPPDLSSGAPGLVGSSLSSSKVGKMTRSDGTVQLTYDGKPLYFYSAEGVTVKAGKFTATGSGQGHKAPAPAKGTFSLVTP
jgi:predicted lipoprotein with Yx(FWY)xxD motif